MGTVPDPPAQDRAAAQDQADFVRAWWPRLHRTAFLMTGDAHEAEDLVQQTLVTVVARWGRVVTYDHPEAYARTVLVNLVRSRWRRARRYADLLVGQRVEDRVPDASADVGVSDALWQALSTLPPRTRAALVLRYYEDLSLAETAAALGCSEGTVKSQASRGLARLRERLDRDDLTLHDTLQDPAAPTAQHESGTDHG